VQARIGRVTASRVGACFTKPRAGSTVSKVRESYLADLLAERLTGKPSTRDFVGDQAAIDWGAQTEPFARAAYTARTGREIDLVGFIDHPSIPMSGGSPDGLVGSEGGVEIKAPNTSTHLETIRRDRIPTPYLWQIKWNLACTGRKWWDYVSFDPRAEDEQFFCLRVLAEHHDLRAMELGVFAFILELEARLSVHMIQEEVIYAP
jgi:hypothetical protein